MNTRLKNRFAPLFAVLCIFLAPVAGAHSQENPENSVTGQEQTTSLGKAIDYAEARYAIRIKAEETLLPERVPNWSDAHESITAWISFVLKNFDKMVYYDNNGDISYLKIVGSKNRSSHAESGSEPYRTARNATFQIAGRNARDSDTGRPDTGRTDAPAPPSVSRGSSENRPIPEGVTFDPPASPHPEGVVLDRPAVPANGTPEGIEIK